MCTAMCMRKWIRKWEVPWMTSARRDREKEKSIERKQCFEWKESHNAINWIHDDVESFIYLDFFFGVKKWNGAFMRFVCRRRISKQFPSTSFSFTPPVWQRWWKLSILMHVNETEKKIAECKQYWRVNFKCEQIFFYIHNERYSCYGMNLRDEHAVCFVFRKSAHTEND